MSETDYYSEAAHGPHEIFELGNYQLESGVTLPNARIAYKTHGTLNEPKSGGWGVALTGRIGALGRYGNRCERVDRSPCG